MSTIKILIVDEKDQYPMQDLFEAAYTDYYNDLIEWVPKDFHVGITSIDQAKNTVTSESEVFTGDFLHATLPLITAPM